MKVAHVQDADQREVSEAIAEVIAERGGLVLEQTPSHLKFEGLNPDSQYSFPKGGYAGTYQHTGERDVEVRIEVAALGPQRLFWRTVWTELIAVIAFFLWNPDDATLWIYAAALLGGILLLVGMLYVGTWRSSHALEEDLYRAVLAHLRSERTVLSDEEMERRILEEEIEGELAKRETSPRRALFGKSKEPAAAPASPPKGGDGA